MSSIQLCQFSSKSSGKSVSEVRKPPFLTVYRVSCSLALCPKLLILPTSALGHTQRRVRHNTESSLCYLRSFAPLCSSSNSYTPQISPQLRFAPLCYASLSYASLRYATLRYATLRFAPPC